MNFVSVKGVKDIQLDGITCEMEKHNGAVKIVTLRDAAGHVLRVCGDYGVSVLTLAPPAKVKRWRLSGKLFGLTDISEDFEHEHEARSRRDSYDEAAGYPGEKLGLTIEQIEVEEAS